MAEILSEEEIKHDLRLKKIDVLNAQIIACQEESTTYNSAYISSAVICALLTAAGGFMSVSHSSDSMQAVNNGVVLLVYFIPIVYLLMVYNVIKYTGFQVQLGFYRHQLEMKLNSLLNDNDQEKEKYVYLMKKKTGNIFFFPVSGLGVLAFVLPTLWLFENMLLHTPDVFGMNKGINIVCGFEVVICLLQALSILYDIYVDKRDSGKPKTENNKEGIKEKIEKKKKEKLKAQIIKEIKKWIEEEYKEEIKKEIIDELKEDTSAEEQVQEQEQEKEQESGEPDK